MEAAQFLNDISLSTAIGAHYGTSMVPERRGESERNEYANTLATDYEAFRQNAVKGGTLDLLDSEFARYRAGYRQRYLDYLRSRSRVVSSFIAGPSNFPARRMAKRNSVADKRLTELVEFRPRARRAIMRKLRPDLAPIMAGDADAVERLEAKIAKAENLQLRMRAANKVVKSKKIDDAAKIIALIEQGFSPSSAAELLKPDFAGRVGFADYMLTNNNANLRRMKQRVEQITAAQSTPATETQNDETGITVEDVPAENRVRIFFPGKPEADVRTKLKSNGYRWAPSLGCWQAYRNYRALEVAREFGGAA